MIFRRALWREFTQTALAIFVALLAILLTTVLIRQLAQAAGGDVPADAVAVLIGFGALTHLPIVLLLTVFISVLLSLSRAYRDSEMVVWFASGLPLTSFIRPVLQFSLPVVILIAFFTLYVTPWAYARSGEYQARLQMRDDTTRIAPGIFRESGDSRRVLFVEKDADQDGRLQNVFISLVGESDIDVMLSSTGSVVVDDKGDRFVLLENGRRYTRELSSARHRVMSFGRYMMLVEESKAVGPDERMRARPTLEMLAQATDRHLGELVWRLGMPIAALLLVLVAIPLSFVNPRAGRGNNLVFAILLYLLYSNSLGIVQAWVSQGRMHFVVGALLPHLMVLALLLLLFYRRLTVSPFWRTLSS